MKNRILHRVLMVIVISLISWVLYYVVWFLIDEDIRADFSKGWPFRPIELLVDYATFCLFSFMATFYYLRSYDKAERERDRYKLFGVENNIYMQIGMVMLVGLLSKTAILLTEYASQARKEGMSLTEAALSSAKVRLRPILMTSLTMIIGMLPLMFASGVGANGSRTIGVCVVGGMLFGTFGLLLSVPVLFVVFQKKSLS